MAAPADARSAGHRIITGLVPGAAIPDEILTDHPDRFRAMIIESGNPAHSLADSARMREALEALDFVVVIDVAMTETARCADYVLPAAVAVREVGDHVLHARVPEQRHPAPPAAVAALPGTLPEPEIHRRLVRALGALHRRRPRGVARAAANSTRRVHGGVPPRPR